MGGATFLAKTALPLRVVRLLEKRSNWKWIRKQDFWKANLIARWLHWNSVRPATARHFLAAFNHCPRRISFCPTKSVRSVSHVLCSELDAFDDGSGEHRPERT